MVTRDDILRPIWRRTGSISPVEFSLTSAVIKHEILKRICRMAVRYLERTTWETANLLADFPWYVNITFDTPPASQQVRMLAKLTTLYRRLHLGPYGILSLAFLRASRFATLFTGIANFRLLITAYKSLHKTLERRT